MQPTAPQPDENVAAGQPVDPAAPAPAAPQPPVAPNPITLPSDLQQPAVPSVEPSVQPSANPGGIPIGTPPDTVAQEAAVGTEPLNEETAAKRQAVETGFSYVDARNPEDIELFTTPVSLEALAEYHIIPIRKESETQYEYGITPLTDRSRLPQLQAAHPDVKLLIRMVSEPAYQAVQHHLYLHTFQAARDGQYTDFSKRLEESTPKQAFQYIAQLAYLMGASDIHIEAESDHARIRFRLDGVLHPITKVETNAYKVFLADLQTKAQMKWGGDVPQSGRISFDLVSTEGDVRTVNMRLETIPSFYGEEIVVRLFNDETRQLKIDTLGFNPDQLKTLLAGASHANGMVLTVGPTGSGKTSTLYALINHLNNPEVKIVTLEDPVEYALAGITQIAVRTEDKESFAEKLRAVMREDPNVVMIGEIRDIDTARTALQAALTGHLVLSTFHAGSASAAISRLLDMMDGNTLLASAIHTVIAQRLVRRVCSHCQEQYEPSADERALINDQLGTLPENIRPDLSTITLTRGKGCPVCHGIGYMGRICLVEMLPITLEIEELMAKDKVTAHQIQEVAASQGMTTLLQDGLIKALSGITTVDEVQAVAGL